MEEKTYNKKINNSRKLKKILKYISIGAFLYILAFSIQNFYQGYHDVDIAFNFLHLKMTGDINTNGNFVSLSNTYLRGVGRMLNSFVWLIIDCIGGIYIGMIFKKGV